MKEEARVNGTRAREGVSKGKRGRGKDNKMGRRVRGKIEGGMLEFS